MNDDDAKSEINEPAMAPNRVRVDISFKGIPVVDAAGWARLRHDARKVTTRHFPELPEWRQKTQE